MLGWKPEPPVGAPATLGELLKNPPVDKRLVLLIDEVDRYIPADRKADWRFFRLLRTLATDGRIRVVLGGERVLREALAEPDGPLFNFANARLLGPLEQNAVEQLVEGPLKQFGYEIVNEGEVVRRICDFTSNHPNVVQRLCHRLLEARGAQITHRITPVEVDAVIDDPAFQEEDFLATYWERATPLERIITLLMAEEDRSYRLSSILDLLADHGVSAFSNSVKVALDRLVNLRCILKHGRAGWEFAVKAFPRVLANTATANDLLIVLKDQFETRGVTAMTTFSRPVAILPARSPVYIQRLADTASVGCYSAWGIHHAACATAARQNEPHQSVRLSVRGRRVHFIYVDLMPLRRAK